MNMDGRLNPCTYLRDNYTVSVPTPCDFRKVIVRASCDLYMDVVKIHDDCTITLRLSYDIRKVSVRFCPSLPPKKIVR